MKYNEIKTILTQHNITDIDVDIVSCVNASLYKRVSNKTYNKLCSFVKWVWDKVDKGYTQLIADIVVDCYQNCGYGYREKLKLNSKDLESYEKRDKVIDIFYDRYWECC